MYSLGEYMNSEPKTSMSMWRHTSNFLKHMNDISQSHYIACTYEQNSYDVTRYFKERRPLHYTKNFSHL
mgnify:CR=1 FL=1